MKSKSGLDGGALIYVFGILKLPNKDLVWIVGETSLSLDPFKIGKAGESNTLDSSHTIYCKIGRLGRS